MQQPDYTSAPYYPYPPNPNPNPTPPPSSSTYASAPPYNHPYPPQFPQIPDPIPPNQNPNSNFPQFTPTPPQTPLSLSSFDHHAAYPPPPPQPNSYYPQSDPHHTAHNYPQSGPYEGNHPKFDQFESSRVDYGLTQFGSGSAHGGYGGVEFDYQGSKTNYPQLGPYEGSNAKFDQFGSSRVDPGSTRFDSGSGLGGYGEGVYAYQGSKTEPYGARGTGSRSWGVDSGSTRIDTGSVFDDFGRPIGKGSAGPTAKVVRAVPKAESQEDVKSGVQKFRVKLLAESGGQTTMDVLCQIGLDGIRMLDPTTSRTLRIYPLETVTRYEILDSSIFAFWAKSSVDIDPRRIRLKSNSYTSSTILDIVTAATIQFKEIGARSRPSDSFKPVEQPPEKKKGLGDWMNLMKPGNEEKDHWVPDEAVSKCTSCAADFSAFVRRHHCRNCGDIFCDKCTHGRIALTAEENAQPVRVCDRCLAEVTHRLNIAKETTNRSTAGLQSHEDLAKKLQEEMEKNRRASSGSRSDGSGRRMKEVACPTCTVHLQVQVPSSGSETIECGVCQHPFLVSAR